VFDLVVNDCAGTLEYATRRAALIKLDFFKLGALFLGQCRCSDFVWGKLLGPRKNWPNSEAETYLSWRALNPQNAKKNG
jgi:hypothetical protein